MNTLKQISQRSKQCGFSLIEVILAIGIFLVTVLALIGLLGPTLQSVDEVEKTDEIASVVNTLNAFLQNSPEINPGGSKFNAIYDAVKEENFATIFVFRQFVGNTTNVRLQIGFIEGETTAGTSIGPEAIVSDFSNAAGPIFRVVLSPSSVIPTPQGEREKYRSSSRNNNGIYELNADLAEYEEGYFPMEVRIFAREEDMQAIQNTMPNPTLEDLNEEEPIFTYNTAVVR